MLNAGGVLRTKFLVLLCQVDPMKREVREYCSSPPSNINNINKNGAMQEKKTFYQSDRPRIP